MERRFRIIVLLMVILVACVPPYAGASQIEDEATPRLNATPSPDSPIAFALPIEEDLANGLVTTQDGERTLEDVASGFTDPAATTEQFVAWGWKANIIRAFHTPPGTQIDRQDVDGIYISVHEFGSPAFAVAALDYSLDVHLTNIDLGEIPVGDLGEYSQVLYGPMPYGNEVTLYVQQGNLLIRLSASSPEGNPTEMATTLMRTMLDSQPATPNAQLT